MDTKPVLREVTRANLGDVILLSDTLSEGQKKCVAPNAVSVAQGSLSPAGWFRAICLDDQVIGFVMVDLYPRGDFLQENRRAVYLWRFMIGRKWQRRGYGRQVMEQLVSYFTRRGITAIYTSVVLSEAENPLQFYRGFGFLDTGIDEEGERLLSW